MGEQVEFYGPVDVYARREDGEWVAWADPFSEVGTGPTFDDAVADLQANLEEYFACVAEELQRHEGEVQFLVPLSEDLKRAEKTAHLLVYSFGAVTTPEPARRTPRALSASSLLEALRARREVRVSPVVCLA